jgi:hypothetical protein
MDDNDTGGASVVSSSDLANTQPQDKLRRRSASSSDSDVEGKSHNSEADELYSEVEENDLDASFEKNKEDSEGAGSSVDDDLLKNPREQQRLAKEAERKAKKAKAEKRKAREDEKSKGKVLTFVDMSKLGYLSRSMSNPNTALERKKPVIPKDLKQPILEDSSEGKSSEEEEESKEPITI